MKTSKLLIQEPPLQVLPSLAVKIGLNEAIVLQQIHYWLENPKAGIIRNHQKWIFNTYEEWQNNFPFWSIPTIKRIFTRLESLGLVISEQLNSKKHDMTKFYRIDYDELSKLDSINLIPSIGSNWDDVNESETTTKNTSPSHKNERVVSPPVEDQQPMIFEKEVIPEQPAPQLEKKSSRDERTNLAPIQAFRRVVGKYPRKAVYDLVIAKVGRKPDDKLIRAAWEAWNARGFNPEGIGWLDWVAAGEVPKNGKKPAPEPVYQEQY